MRPSDANSPERPTVGARSNEAVQRLAKRTSTVAPGASGPSIFGGCICTMSVPGVDWIRAAKWASGAEWRFVTVTVARASAARTSHLHATLTKRSSKMVAPAGAKREAKASSSWRSRVASPVAETAGGGAVGPPPNSSSNAFPFLDGAGARKSDVSRCGASSSSAPPAGAAAGEACGDCPEASPVDDVLRAAASFDARATPSRTAARAAACGS
mmetsp:Transcript_41340/g.127764  ORF Transcript_41340/g.127764 Transcript_41340/m.127764 type:complete len:213 (-) Transcript_41340:2263-2901(-)